MSSLFETYDRMVAIGGRGPRQGWLSRARQQFEARTGAFKAEDPWFEARTRAFWDDLLSTRSTLLALEADFDDDSRRWMTPLTRAHRGLFQLIPREHEKGEAGPLRVLCVLTSAEFPLHDVDDSLRPGLRTVESLFDGRIVADSESGRLALLPGAFFHPAEATSAILSVVASMHSASGAATPPRADGGRSVDAVLDALLSMERTFRTLSRVKASYAYRPLGAAGRVGT